MRIATVRISLTQAPARNNGKQMTFALQKENPYAEQYPNTC